MPPISSLFALILLCALFPCDAVKLTFFLHHQESRITELRDIFQAVSYPESQAWGSFISFEEVVRLQQPHASTISVFDSHLTSLGLFDAGATVLRSVAGDKVVAIVEEAELHARFAFTRVNSSSELTESDVRALVHPEAMGGVIETVAIGGLRSQRRRRLGASLRPWSPPSHAQRPWPVRATDGRDPPELKCLSDQVNPTCLRFAYGLNESRGNSSQNAQAVIVNQPFLNSDLTALEKQYHLPPQTIADEHCVGKNTGSPGIEGSLDTQYIITTGQLVTTWWVFIDGHASDPYADWLVWAANASEIPFVHSLSVGEPEEEYGAANVRRMNAEVMALGARGVSVLFASGDTGDASSQKYGAASPYVTAVGGVFNGEIGNDVLQADSESTGGFSTLDENPIQPYQTAAVASWLKTSGSRPHGFNASRRCVPDVSAYDAGCHFIKGGEGTAVIGTSCSAPMVAGMVSLINDALLNAGGRPLGFLNPFLYANEAAFFDITAGNNGYDATVGYDPASGLGTFDGKTFTKLREAALRARGLARQ